MELAESNRRLMVLADFLDKLPRERFNYVHWVGSDWKGMDDLSCGTTACALGWGTTIPEFKALGLRLTKGRGKNGTVVTELIKKALDAGHIDGYNAALLSACEVFGLNRMEAEYLFIPSARLFDAEVELNAPQSPDDYASAQEVANHIRRFVRARS